MGRRKRGRDIDGVVLLDKPLGCSSNAALQRVRRAYDARKAGHTGSLDPLASGLLPVCLGEATKISAYLLAADKHYRVAAMHGARTATGDREGDIVARSAASMPDAKALQSVLETFLGAQRQIPPMYSALKRGGKRLYEHARAGETVEREPRPVTVHRIVLVDCDEQSFTLDVSVSSGTYVRTLVEDIAAAWGGEAHVGSLRRTAIGELGGDRPMVELADIEARAAEGGSLNEWLLPVSTLLEGWPVARLSAPEAEAIRHGQAVAGDTHGLPADVFCLADAHGRLLGLGRLDDCQRIAPRRLFARAQS